MKKLALVLSIVLVAGVVYAAETIKFKEQVLQQPIAIVQPDSDKQIEITKQVDQTEIFTINQLKQQIKNNDDQIDRLSQANEDLQAKINKCVDTLKLTIK